MINLHCLRLISFEGLNFTMPLNIDNSILVSAVHAFKLVSPLEVFFLVLGELFLHLLFFKLVVQILSLLEVSQEFLCARVFSKV